MFRRLAVATVCLLLVPVTTAHAAPDPRDFQTRLLHDCIDDAGADGLVSTGYDLHSLDLWEAWDGSRLLVHFRAVLNGDGPATITLAFQAGGAAKSYAWTTSNGDSWSPEGFRSGGKRDDVWVNNDPSQGRDGDRFALHGTVRAADLGGVDTRLTGFRLASDDNGRDDEVPGFDGLAGDCRSPYRKDAHVLAGPGGYATLSVADKPLLADTVNFLDVRMENVLRSDAQQATLRITGHSGEATARLHDPDGDYVETASFPLGKKGSAGSLRILHLALEGPPGAEGTVSLELTTDLGGRETLSHAYRFPAATPSPTTSTDGEEGSPGLGILSVLAALAALASARRLRRGPEADGGRDAGAP